MSNKKLAARLASLSPEQREILLKKLKEQKKQEGKAAKASTISPVPRGQESYDLSYSQQRLWFLDQLQSGSASYNISAALRLTGYLDVEVLRRVFEEIVERHEALRTSFVTIEGKGQQVIHPVSAWELPVEDISPLPEEVKDKEAEGAIRIEAQLPFDLSQPPLLRTRLIKLNDQQHILLVTMHHIVSDGWSMGVLIKEVGHLYQQLLKGRQAELAPLSIQYVDFAQWQRSWMQGEELAKQIDYWKESLEEVSVLEMPVDFSRPAVQSHNGAHLPIQLDEQLAGDLLQFSRRHGVTLFMTLLAAFNVLLHRYSRQDDICVGSPIANRNHAEVEPLIGCFVNTIAFRSDLSGDPSFLDFLQQVQKTTLGGYNNQDVPFERLVDELGVSREMSHSPLFQVMFSLTNTPKEQGLELEGLAIDLIPSETNTAKFDLSLNLNEENGEIYGEWEYNVDLYANASIERMNEHYTELLRSIVTMPEVAISRLNMLGHDERQQVLVGWNQSQSDYDREKSIVSFFEDQVGKNGDSVALNFLDQSLTYAETNALANQIAHSLIAKGIKPGDRVGLCTERCLEVLPAIIGILKTGAAYIPLDPAYPEERLSYMIDDTAISIIIAQRELRSRLPQANGDKALEIWSLEEFAENLSSVSQDNPNITIDAQSPAYVMYTSGSTGKPKGIEVTHRNVTRLVINTNFMVLDETTVFLMFAPISFDAATLEMWGPLLNGGRLVIAPPGSPEPEAFGEVVKGQEVNSCWLTAALFHYFAEYHIEVFKPLKFVLTGGDVVSPILARRVLDGMPGIVLINGYGPTENTTFTTCFPMQNSGQVRNSVPIGFPIANTQVYILDQHMQPVPAGVPGELYAGGDGVSNGYLNRDELTQEVFLEHEFHLRDRNILARLYKTGDLARWSTDGSVEYAGRIDQQVKIRGFRIEIGEIENTLGRVESVREVAVIAREDQPGVKRLVGYIVPNEGFTVDGQELKTILKKQIPDYMIPSAFVEMESLPVNANGKLDRKALPEPDEFLISSSENVAPRTHAEKVLVQIWSEVLNVKDIGIHDNFFEFGGDSILSIQIIARAQREGVQITAKQIFENQTIAELALAANQDAKEILAEQGEVTGEVPLTPIQHWFFEQEFEHPDHYNQSVLLTPNADLSAEMIEQALGSLLEHHDALRLRFQQDAAGQWLQDHASIDEALAQNYFEACEVGFSTSDEEKVEFHHYELQGGLNLQSGPTLKAALSTFADGQRRLLLVIHHLVVDGVSWRILLEDFTRALDQLQAGDSVELGVKSTAFKHWGEALLTYQQGTESLDNAEIWLQNSEEDSVAIEADFVGGENTVNKELTKTVTLDKAYTERLLREANLAYRTEINDLLLCALFKTIGDWSGEHSLAINLEGHGREFVSDEIEISRTVGWFTSIYPVLLRTGEELSGNWEGLLKTVKEQLRAIPKNGFDYSVQRYLHQNSRITDQLAGSAKADITFNYLGQFDALLEGNNYFELATEQKGNEHHLDDERTSLLDVNSHIVEGQLEISWIFSEEVFKPGTVDELAAGYLKSLIELIDFCADENNSGYTPSDFPLISVSQSELDEIVAQHDGIETIIPLSPMQQGMLFHSLYDTETGVYFEQLAFELGGSLDEDCFLKAWQMTIDRHQSLRSGFLWEDVDRPLQIITKSALAEIVHVDWQSHSTGALDKDLERFLEADRSRGFDFTRPGLTRLTAIRLPDGKTKMVFSFHHILIDGWSLPILMGELFGTYGLLLKGEEPQLAPASKYEDFIALLERQDKSEAKAFWQSYLAGFEAPTNIPVKQPLYKQQQVEHEYKEQVVSLTTTQTAQLQKIARDHHVTLNTILQAVWGMMLARYSGENDVLFGATVSGRPAELPGVETTVGLFINTLPLRVKLEKDTEILALLKSIHEQQVESRRFEATPLVDIHHWSEIPGEQSLFESILVFENYPVSEELKGEDQLVDIAQVQSYEHTNYPLTLIVEPAAKLGLKLSYDAMLFDEETIHRMLGHVTRLLHHILELEGDPVLSWPMLMQDEYEQIVESWNNVATEYPREKTVNELFEAWAVKTPDATAVVFGDQTLSYRALDEKSNQLAHYLLQHGIQQQQFVGISMERCADWIVSLLAVVKIGAVYVPLDPSYPEERLVHLVTDTSAPIIITQNTYKDNLANIIKNNDSVNATLVILEDEAEQIAKGSSQSPGIELTEGADQLCYVVYTSGSTGLPKGVPAKHRGVVRLVVNTNYVDLKPGDRISHSSNISFDASTFEVWGALLNGACLVAFEKEMLLSPEQFVAAVKEHKINTLFLTTALFNAFSQHFSDVFDQLDVVCFGGEACDPQQVRNVVENTKLGRLLHMYGPSENTTYSTWYEVTSVPQGATTVPIGGPLANSTCYILDEFKHPVPAGVVGEIYTGGDGVCPSYWNNPEKTAESFLADPFSARENARMYKTGDLGRYLPDGNIEILGRADDQVKLRGFRIELGEIEANMTEIAEVAEAVAVVTSAGSSEEGSAGKKLVAYVVLESDSELSSSDIIRQMQARLPSHMIPAAIVMMDELPINANGKVDKRKLPEPTMDLDGADNYVAPRNDVESTFCEIWQQVLHLEQVGIFDNFFELGGDSILSIQIISRAKRAGYTVTAKQIFDFQTVAALSEVISHDAANLQTEQGVLEGNVPLLPIQHWYLNQQQPHPQHFNQSVLLSVSKSIDASSLKQVFGEILKQHDALRIHFSKAQEGEVRQQSYSPKEFIDTVWQEKTLDSAGEGFASALLEVADSAQASLSLTQNNGALLAIEYFDCPQLDQNRLLVVVNHLVIDVFSWRILLEDLQTGLSQLVEQQPVDLGPKTSSLRQWGNALENHVQSQNVASELSYWQTVVAKPVAEIKPELEGVNDQGSAVMVEGALTLEQTQELLTQANRTYRTEINDLLMAALARTLGAWQDGTDFSIDLEGHGREEFDTSLDVSRTVGWFTSLFPVVVSNKESFSDLILANKTALSEVPNKGFAFGLLKYLGHQPLETRSQVSFNYLGQLDNVLAGSEEIGLATEDIGPENHPENFRPYLLDVSGRVLDGQLTMAFRYNEKQFAKETVEKLLQSYLQALQSIVQHCLTADRVYQPSDFPLANLTETQLAEIVERTPNLEAIYPLSPVQEGMLFHTLYEPGTWVYYDQISVDVGGHVNEVALERAWQSVFDRHQILRTGFVWENVDRPYQVVTDGLILPFNRYDWSDLNESEAEAKLEQFLIDDRNQGFDFNQAGISRIAWIKLPTGRYQLVWSFHHILLDGWSMPLVFSEVFNAYETFNDGRALNLPEAPNYQSYIEYLEERSESETEAFWKEYLKGFSAPTEITVKRSAAEITAQLAEIGDSANRYQEQEVVVAGDLLVTLNGLAKTNHLTLNHIVQGTWSVLLNRYSGEQDVLFGTTVSGRPAELAGIEEMVGLFINTLPMRAQVEPTAGFIDWLKTMTESQRELKHYESSSLVDVQKCSEVSSKVALFESILVFENYPVDEALQSHQLSLDVGEVFAFQQTNFPLTLIVIPEHNDQLTLRFSYDSALFSESVIARMLGHLEVLLQGIADNPVQPIASLPLVTAKEERSLLYDLNLSARDFPVDEPLSALFEAWVERSPDAIATEFGDSRLTYRELNQAANRLAHLLKAKGIQRQDKVGLCLDRCESMIVATLAVVKLGAVYVPLDPNYPVERLSYMLEDTQAPLVLTKTENLPVFDFLEDRSRVTNLEDLTEELSTQPTDNLPKLCSDRESAAELLAYVIYTSGSTGKPKGVCVPYRGVSRLVLNTNYVDLKPEDRIAHASNVSFDAATFEMWGALLNGSVLVGVDKDTLLDPNQLRSTLKDKKITTFFTTTALFNLYSRENADVFSDLTYLLFGGEACDPNTIRTVLEEGKPKHLLHMYGPTENTTYTSFYEINEVLEGATTVPIGIPLANTENYILDDQLRPVPLGVPGEIYTSGLGLAHGYLNREELTQEVFIPHPFKPNEKMYKTGDLARYTEEGAIEILGRIDDQVKVRGYRIELGEIETAVTDLPMVAKSFVMAQTDPQGTKHVVAYLVPASQGEDSTAPSTGELRAALKKHLPDYMIPAAFIQLEELPINPNGKVDRRALPAFDGKIDLGNEYVAPRNETEQALAEIWQSVMEIEQVGIYDDFFELGGHSLLATQIHSRIRQNLGVELPLKALFEVPTIEALAEIIKSVGWQQNDGDDFEDEEEFEEGVL